MLTCKKNRLRLENAGFLTIQSGKKREIGWDLEKSFIFPQFSDDDLSFWPIKSKLPPTLSQAETVAEIVQPSPVLQTVPLSPIPFASSQSIFSPIYLSDFFSPNITSSMMLNTSSSSGLNTTSQSNVFSSITFDESYEYVPCSGIVNKDYFKNCGNNFELPETLVLRTSDNFTYESTDCKRNIMVY